MVGDIEQGNLHNLAFLKCDHPWSDHLILVCKTQLVTCYITLFVVVICVSVSPFYVSRSMGYLYMVLSVRLVCLILTWVQFSSYFSQFLYAILGSVVKFCQFCLIGIQNVLLTHTAWFLTVLFLTLPEGSLSKCNGGDPLHVVPTAPEQVLWVWRSVKVGKTNWQQMAW